MIRVPDPGRFELRLMDGSANPYLLQAAAIAAGIDGMNTKKDPGKPLFVNMYTDGHKYTDIKKLPGTLTDALDYLEQNRMLKDSFGEDVINSYIKLKKQEYENFSSNNNFSKSSSITEWEKTNTLDC